MNDIPPGITRGEPTTDPRDRWALLRQETPVFWSPELSAWLVTSQHAARIVLSDRRFDPAAYCHARPSPLALPSSFELSEAANADVHRAVLACLSAGALPIDDLFAAVRTVLDVLPPTSHRPRKVEVVSQVAEPVAKATTKLVLGVDAHSLETLIALIALAAADDRPDHRLAAGRLFNQQMRGHIAIRRSEPSEDLLSRLAAEWRSRGLIDEWLVAFLAPMLNSLARGFAGRLITHTAVGLAEYPEVQEEIAATGIETARRAVIEAARLDPINQSLWRYARAPVELAGSMIAAGDLLLVIVPAVCRDPTVYTDPSAFRLDRLQRSEAFGYGPHACSGRELAVTVAALTIHELLHVRGLRLSSDPEDTPDYLLEFGRSCVRLPLLLVERPARRVEPSAVLRQGEDPWTTCSR